MQSSQEFYQCLICKRFLENLWKTESHISKHEDSFPTQSVCRGNRGRLPIQKVIFHDCYISLLKEKVNLESLKTKLDVPKKRRGRPKGKVSKPFLEEIEASSSERPRRQCLLKATSRLKELTTYLNCENNGRKSVDNEDLDNDKSDKESSLSSPSTSSDESENASSSNEETKKLWKSRRSLSQHKVKAHDNNEKLHPCPIPSCTFQGLDKPHFRYHFRCHCQAEEQEFSNYINIERRFSCKFCLVKFKSLNSLQKHLDRNHPSKNVKCKLCNDEFGNSVFDLLKHMSAHSRNIYPQRFGTSRAREVKNNEASDSERICPITTCSFKYTNYSTIAYHLRCHFYAGEKQAILTSGNPEQLKVILKKYKSPGHPLKSKHFYCKFCLSRELSLESLQAHLRKVHSESKLNCPYCNEEFGENVKQLISHVKAFHQNHIYTEEEKKEKSASAPRFKCDKCLRILSSQQVLDNHINKLHNPNQPFDEEYAQRPYPCTHLKCPKRFKRLDQLRVHLEIHKGKRFPCGFSNCNRKFSNMYALRAHRQCHIDIRKNEWKCKICGAILSRKDKLKIHLKKVHDPTKEKFGTRYILPRIKYSTAIKTDLEENKSASETSTHLTQEAAEIKVDTMEEEIELVDKIILTENGEAVHLKGEELQPVSSAISTLPIRTSHDPTIRVDRELPEIRKYHNNNNNVFKCSICSAEFIRGYTLQRHLKTVHQKTLVDEAFSSNVKQEDAKVSLLCGLCAYPAKDKRDLKKHMKSHGGPIRKFKCFRKFSAGKKIVTCGKSFELEEKLNAHVKRAHDSEKKYKCGKCDRGYSSEMAFKRHVDYGHNAKKHCKECDKYYTPDSYNAHMKRHREEGTDKFKCMLCGDNLSCKRTLQQHIDLIHIGKSFDKKAQTSAGDSRESVKTESTTTDCDKTGDHSLSILGI